MKPLTEHEFAEISRVVSEPSRCAILSLLSASAGPLACYELCAQLPLTQATVSHHMKELVECGLVRAAKNGRAVFYQTDYLVVESYLRELRDRIMPAQWRGMLRPSSMKGARAPARSRAAKDRS